MNFNISDADIEYASKYLFKEVFQFDEERRAFIKNLSSCFLHAAPGAGKTTALLVKLFILAKKLASHPNDAQGVLVLSHTNVAVDTIRERFGARAENIEKYPSHISTLQGFVNKFLFFPYFYSLYAKSPDVISFEQMKDYATRFLKCNPQFSVIITNYCSRAMHCNAADFLAGLYIAPHGELSSINDNFNLKDNTSKVYKACLEFASNMKKKAIFLFDIAYVYALEYLKSCPSLKGSFRRRFPYVFMDEVQDSSAIQLEVLASVFAPISDDLCFQMIGDLNQRLSPDDFKMPQSLRLNNCFLQKSMRFSQKIALAISQFSANNLNIVSDHVCPYKPRLYLYDVANISDVIPFFMKEWKQYEMQLNIKSPVIFVIGSRLNSANSSVTVSDYFKGNDFSCADDTVDFSSSMSKVKMMLSYAVSVEKSLGLQYGHVIHDERFVSLLYCVSQSVDYDINNLTRHVNEILGPHFRRDAMPPLSSAISNRNNHNISDKHFHSGSIHSVKGLTSDAVLLLDTHYNKKYTSQFLLSSEVFNNPDPYTRRLVYVALSRARYFAAWAIPKSIFPELRVDFRIWDVCDISNGNLIEPPLYQASLM